MSQSDIDIARVAQQVSLAMALDRDGFKSKAYEHLHGAIKEFYKARLCDKNGIKDRIDHWYREVENLLERSFSAVITDDIKDFKDRLVAIDQVITMIQSRDANYRDTAKKRLSTRYGINIKELRKPLTDQDTDDFWAQVQEVIQEDLDEDGNVRDKTPPEE